MSKKRAWALKSHTDSNGQYYELTDGKISLVTRDEPRGHTFEPLVQALKETGCNWESQKKPKATKQDELKRFRIYAPDNTMMTKCDSVEEAVAWLKTRDMTLEDFNVEDVVDDIEVKADYLLEAWDQGERPGDLQMF